FGSTLEFHCHDTFVDHLGNHRADHVHAQDAIGFGVGDDLHLADGLVHGHGTAVGGEREAAGLVVEPFVLALLLGLADPGDFRLGVDHRRNHVVVHVARLAGD